MASETNPVNTSDKEWKEFANRNMKRNFSAGVISNAFSSQTGVMFLDQAQVLPAFLQNLTTSQTLIAVIVTSQRLLTSFPQLFFANILQRKFKKKPIYLGANLIYILCCLLMASSVFILPEYSSRLTLLSFAVFHGIAYISFGMMMVTMQDMIGKMIPPEKRGGFVGIAQAFTQILTILYGLLITFTLAKYEYLNNYAMIFTYAAIVMLFCFSSFLFIKEPVHSVIEKRVKQREFLKESFKILKKDKRYFYYFFFRFFLSLQAMAMPFYILFAIQKLGIDQKWTGVYMSVGMGIGILSTLIVGYIGNKKGFKIVLQLIGIARMSYPLFVIFSPFIIKFFQGMFPSVDSATMSVVIYGFVFILIWIDRGMVPVGLYNYALEIAPKELRPTYIGFANTVLFPVMFIGILAGAIVDLASFTVLFLLVTCFGLGCFICATKLEEPRKAESLELKNLIIRVLKFLPALFKKSR